MAISPSQCKAMGEATMRWLLVISPFASFLLLGFTASLGQFLANWIVLRLPTS